MENNQGCQAFVEKDQLCGETRNLEILREFQQLYEDKLQTIDSCECNSSQMKIQMLQDYVKDLTEQNTLLVQVVEELEHEAAERVSLLEERLKHSSNASYDIIKSLQEYDINKITDHTDILRNLTYLQNDQKNLLQFIKRIRDDGVWSTKGLRFYLIADEDLSGRTEHYTKTEVEHIPNYQYRSENNERVTKQTEHISRDRLNEMQKLRDVTQTESNKDQLMEVMQDMQKQLKEKTDEYAQLEKSMKDMREALTAEVADKYDNIVALRREYQVLQEQCQQADKQTHFKDDIIKEMRKELKQLRAKLDSDIGKENESMKKRMEELEEENNIFRSTISEAEQELTSLHKLIDSYLLENGEFEIRFWKCISDFNKYCYDTDLQSDYIVKSYTLTRQEMGKLQTILKQSLNNNKMYMDEVLLLSKQNREQSERIEVLRFKVNNKVPSDKMLALYENKKDMFKENESDSSGSIYSATEFGKTINILKTDINRMIRWRGSDHELEELNKRIAEFEDSFHDIENKDQLINNKDEMIKLQSETLNLVQIELKELRSKLMDSEVKEESRLQEIYNLQQALKLNQNTINELENALKITEEKVENMQQAVELYMATINIIESAKNKAEVEIEQQRITIGNLQDALVNTKQHLEEVQGKNALDVSSGWKSRWTGITKLGSKHSVHDIKEKNNAIYLLHQDLVEMQSQYVDCYGQIVKLSQFTDCLRKSNYELKMTNTNFKTDIDKLLEENKSYKNIIELLENFVKSPLLRNETLEYNVIYMKHETSGLMNELKVALALMNLSDIDSINSEHVNLINSLGALQDHSSSLIDRLEYMQHQMAYDTKWKESICIEVQKLKTLLEIKKTELHKYDEELKITKAELNNLSQRNKEYANRIQFMEHERGDYEQKTTEYQKELFNCSNNLTDVQHRLEILNELLIQKSDEILTLHAELSMKTDAVTALKKENDRLKQKATEDTGNMCQNIETLQAQLLLHNATCLEIHEKYNKTLSDLEFVKQRESKLQDLILQEKKTLVHKLDASQEDAGRLNGIINDLKKENESLKKGYNAAKENIASLKNEIIQLAKSQNAVICEKHILEEQIKNSNANIEKYGTRNEFISHKLDECIKELNVLQVAKENLEERNAQLQLEIESVLKTFKDLNQEVRHKNESVMNLELELAEYKSSREEVCAESRVVVNNVRSWLREQQRVNDTLNNIIKEKNSLIDNLKSEKGMLITNVKEVSEKYDTLFQELELCKQYLLNQNHCKFSVNPVPMVHRSVFTWGSQGSTSSDTTNSSPTMDNNVYELDDEYPVNENKYNPEKWMRVVQEMSGDLEKSNRYWQANLKGLKKSKSNKTNKAKST